MGKILQRSLKWDQPGISSLVRLKVTSKTSLIVQKNGPEKNRLKGLESNHTCIPAAALLIHATANANHH